MQENPNTSRLLMLTIRKPQLQAISASRVEVFYERVRYHLAKCFPDECRAIGEATVADLVRHGVERADHYGFKSQREIVLYINLMFVFGPDFDEDTDFPWAAGILNDETLSHSQKIEKAYFAGRVNAHKGRGVAATIGGPE
jgi:hypothetical protein